MTSNQAATTSAIACMPVVTQLALISTAHVQAATDHVRDRAPIASAANAAQTT